MKTAHILIPARHTEGESEISAVLLNLSENVLKLLWSRVDTFNSAAANSPDLVEHTYGCDWLSYVKIVHEDGETESPETYEVETIAHNLGLMEGDDVSNLLDLEGIAANLHVNRHGYVWFSFVGPNGWYETIAETASKLRELFNVATQE